MATHFKNLSSYDPENVADANDMKFGVVVAEWNVEITGALLEGCVNTLRKHGAKDQNIEISWVPGSFELTYGASLYSEAAEVDAIICLGCVIQGETRHFDFICEGVTNGITELNIRYPIPVIFGVLTTNDMQQALDRAGGKHGNKGDEAAVTAIKMVDLKRKLEK
jgi:6,7-dimethyl-8-ribityllumazine synthase